MPDQLPATLPSRPNCPFCNGWLYLDKSDAYSADLVCINCSKVVLTWSAGEKYWHKPRREIGDKQGRGGAQL